MGSAGQFLLYPWSSTTLSLVSFFSFLRCSFSFSFSFSFSSLSFIPVSLFTRQSTTISSPLFLFFFFSLFLRPFSLSSNSPFTPLHSIHSTLSTLPLPLYSHPSLDYSCCYHFLSLSHSR